MKGPRHLLQNYQLHVGKIINLKENGKIRLNASLGMAYTSINKPYDWEYDYDKTNGENYNYQHHKTHLPSFIIKPEIEFPISHVHGFSIAPILLLNRKNTYVGVGVGLMIGKLKKRNSDD